MTEILSALMTERTFKTAACLSLAFTCFLPCSVSGENDGSGADSREFAPARPPETLEARLQQLDPPRVEDGRSYNLFCVTRIESSGGVEGTTCLNDADIVDSGFRKKVVSVLDVLEFSPAAVDGETYEVEFYFQVLVNRKPTGNTVYLLPNWGDNYEKYGAIYEAPQRLNIESHPFHCFNLRAVSRIHVDIEGHPTAEPEIKFATTENRTTDRCKRKLRVLLRTATYIPAHSGGTPVPAVHTEIWGYWGRYRFL